LSQVIIPNVKGRYSRGRRALGALLLEGDRMRPAFTRAYGATARKKDISSTAGSRRSR